MKKQRLLKTIALGLIAMVGVNAWAADNLLTKASKVYSDNKNTQVTVTDGAITLTSSSNKGEARAYMTFSNYKIKKGNAFIAIEYSTTGSVNKHLVRHFKVDDINYEKTTSSTAHTIEDLSGEENHKLLLISPLHDAGISEGSLLNKYLGVEDATTEMTLNELDVILVTAAVSTSITIHNIGLYTIRDIKDVYLNNITNKKFQISWNSTSAYYMYLELVSGTTDKTITVNTSSNVKEVPTNAMELIMATLGTPTGTNTELDLRGVKMPTDATPLKKDILSEYINNSNQRSILFNTDEYSAYKYLPTMTRRIAITDNNYFDYKDGTDPSGLTSIVNTGKSSSIYNYTRNFVEGYNSCCLPFDVTTANLPTGLSAYVFSNCTTEGAVTFSAAGATISAGTPFVVKAAEAGLYIIPAAGTPNAISTLDSYYETAASNDVKLVGSFVDEPPMGSGKSYETSYRCYGITKDGSYLKEMDNNTKTTYYRAFLTASTADSAPLLSVIYDNCNTTGISVKREMMLAKDAPVYNLNGVLMQGNNLPKGIYVKNGKKYIVK